MAVVLGVLLQVSAWGGIDQAKPGELPAGHPGIVGPAGGAARGGGGAADPHAGMFGGSGGAALPAGGMIPGGPAAGAPSRDPVEAAMAATFAKQDRAAFERGLQLDAFRLMAINHLDQVKIVDSWARQTLSKIRNRQSIDGKDPVITALDMAFRPEAWMDRNIIYIQAIPVREALTAFAPGANDTERRAEQERIMHEGLVSPDFLMGQQVLMMLDNMSRDSTKAQAVGKVFTSIETFRTMAETLNILPPPPSADWGPNKPWINPITLVMSESGANGEPATAPGQSALAGAKKPESPYTPEQTLKIKLAFRQLAVGWRENDVNLVNTGMAGLAALAPTIDPPHYPSETKRVVELWYNRTFNGTLIAFVYFLAMTLFLMVAVGVVKNAGKVQRIAWGTFALAVALHVAVMGVRWWLAGRIPIQNQFESVLGAACSGCIIGLILEWRKRNGIYGVAFAFVGFLAMTTCLAAPYVFGTDLGGAVGKVAGILNSAWLYIHVNVVIASYALIFAAAVIGLIYLGLRLWHWINPIEPGMDEFPGGGGSMLVGGTGGGGGAVAAPAGTLTVAEIEKSRSAVLETLDQANMVVLQMAMWLLGIGIICGAVWADRSWGRPWGWDPKETFALVTWIVYLIIVHLRFVTRAKADLSAVLAVVGCVVMMFNWIGVNFWLKGLHSYA
jgi:cytochrome c-type biogenesis protein CcsB